MAEKRWQVCSILKNIELQRTELDHLFEGCNLDIINGEVCQLFIASAIQFHILPIILVTKHI